MDFIVTNSAVKPWLAKLPISNAQKFLKIIASGIVTKRGIRELPILAKNSVLKSKSRLHLAIWILESATITIKIVAKCLEEDRFQVERDLNREYRRILTENNIDIAYPQVVVNYSKSKDIDVTPQDKKSADNFTKKQKKLSKDMDEQQN